MKISAIVFDNNGVLTTNDDENTYKVVSEMLKVSVGEVKNLFNPFVRDLDSGRITQGEFYSLVLRKAMSDVPVEVFMEKHLGAYKPKDDVQEYVKLLSLKYKTYILSNFGDAFWKMFEIWKLNNIFEKKNVFVSADMKMAKPDKEIYLEVLKRISTRPEEVVFIDDREENIISANKLNINGILFKNLEGLKLSLKELGVKI